MISLLFMGEKRKHPSFSKRRGLCVPSAPKVFWGCMRMGRGTSITPRFLLFTGKLRTSNSLESRSQSPSWRTATAPCWYFMVSACISNRRNKFLGIFLQNLQNMHFTRIQREYKEKDVVCCSLKMKCSPQSPVFELSPSSEVALLIYFFESGEQGGSLGSISFLT